MGAAESHPKELDVEVVKATIPDSDGALVTGLRKGQKFTITLRRPLKDVDSVKEERLINGYDI